ncbi:MAG: NAD-dependent epimerase/dehydratase family protein [Candidatus Thioglobus sp.]|nr:NAD-dependent epimerase/dehydratase family protein [Candidatus Thioglobus sp.]
MPCKAVASSIRVNGNQNSQAFLETDAPNPQEAYAISKFEAECGLLELAKKTDLEVVIIRPPLIYGANAAGNFGRLIAWASAKNPLPLPLDSVNNQRSLLAMDNLLDFIILCTTAKKAANEVFLLADDEDLSTTELLQKIAKAFGKKPLLLPIPAGFMIFILGLFGKKADAIRLFSSLQIDNSKAKNLLGWQPLTAADKQLAKIVTKIR